MSRATGSRVGIRREDKHAWERRAPLTPDHVRQLTAQGIGISVQPSSLRVFEDEEYVATGARLDADLADSGVILGVKEMPPAIFDAHDPRTAYVFFSHTIKGQPVNMPMLRRLMDRQAHLFDYERILDDSGRRLVMFGPHAGAAGMIDALWTLGRRLAVEGWSTPLAELQPAHAYPSLTAAKETLRELAARIGRDGWPAEVGPVVCGFAGYGNVSQGAQDVYAHLDPQELTPEELASREHPGPTPFQKVVFREEHLVEPVDPAAPFELQHYYDHPDRYRSVFDRYLPRLSMLVNAIYWDARYPRLISREALGQTWPRLRGMLRVIADITCDVGGAIECTVKATDPGNPVYVFEPLTSNVRDGVEGDGPVILAVDTLPCELPRESSQAFGERLLPLVPELARLDRGAEWTSVELSGPLRRACIVWGGELTADYRYLRDALSRDG